MCISPVSIKNPNYGLVYKDIRLQKLKDTTSVYIPVPCGYCSECIRKKTLFIVQRLQMEALSNYLFFCTLTYNNEMIPTVVTSSGYTIKYADWHDLQLLFKRLRKIDEVPKFRYFAVTERGKSRGRPHMHILFLVPKEDSDDAYTPVRYERILYSAVLDNWKRKIGGSKRKPIYKPLCSFQRRLIGRKVFTNYDLHYVVPFLFDNGVT